MTLELVWGDCLEVLAGYPEAHFDAACFSPPYGVGEVFDPRVDFRPRGRFLPYALAIARVSRVWAVNLTQAVHAGRNLPFLEELVLALAMREVELWDRWVVVKPTAMPRRGERLRTNIEFVYLFSAYAARLVKVRSAEVDARWRTGIDVRGHRSQRVAPGARGARPYFREIPRAVFDAYAPPGGRVLDPFVGSGTSLVEAEALGLDALGIERDRAIYEDTRQRLGVPMEAVCATSCM